MIEFMLRRSEWTAVPRYRRSRRLGSNHCDCLGQSGVALRLQAAIYSYCQSLVNSCVANVEHLSIVPFGTRKWFPFCLLLFPKKTQGASYLRIMLEFIFA